MSLKMTGTDAALALGILTGRQWDVVQDEKETEDRITLYAVRNPNIVIQRRDWGRIGCRWELVVSGTRIVDSKRLHELLSANEVFELITGEQFVYVHRPVVSRKRWTFGLPWQKAGAWIIDCIRWGDSETVRA